MAEPEKVKVLLDISDVLVKRAAEVKAAEQAEKAKIAAAKREAAAVAREDKAAFEFAVRLAKQEEAEREAAAKRAAQEQAKAAKYLADIKRRYFEQEQKQAEEAERAAARAAKGPSEWTLALKANTEAMNAQKGAINQSAEAMGKVAAAASTLDPALGAIVAGGQKLAGVMSAGVTAAQGLGAGLGTVAAVAAPLALAVGAVALAWQDYEADIAAAEEATRKAREEQEKMIEAMGGIRSILSSNKSEIDRLAVNYGRMTEEQFQVNELTRRYEDQLASARAPLEKMIEAQRLLIDGSEEQGRKLADLEAALRTANEANAQGLSAALENLEIEQERANAEKVLAERLKAREEADRAATKAARETAEADRIAAEEAQRRTNEVEFGYDVFLRDEQAAADARKQAYEDTKWTEEFKRAEFAKTLAAGRKAAEEAKRAREEDLNAVQQYAGGIEDVVGSANDIVDLVYDKRVSNAEDLYDRYEQALEDGDEATAKSLKKQYEAEKEGAMKAFKVNKSLAITSASLSTIVAVAKALEAGWPAALVTVPAAAAAGAAQIAAATMQEPPEFDDTPQVMRAQGSGRSTAEFKGGDFVAAAQTPQGLREQVDRLDAGGRREILAERMNRTMAGRTVTRDLRAVTRGIWRSA